MQLLIASNHLLFVVLSLFLHHLELLMTTEMLRKQIKLKLTETDCICITSSDDTSE